MTAGKVFGRCALFIGGALFGSAGIRILSSKDAKKVYTHTTAAFLRMGDEVMRTATTLQENCSDILADAKKINEEREHKESACTICEEDLTKDAQEESKA